MDSEFFKFIFEIDSHLAGLVQKFHTWAYAILFSMIVAETGLVVFAILPGDSLLFAAGALSSQNHTLDIRILLPLMALAAFIGDQVNYGIGWLMMRKRVAGGIRILSEDKLGKARRFYESKGGHAIIVGRFIPVIRSVVPMSAALSGMSYARFVAFSCAGAALWTCLFTLLGFYFGKLPVVRDHFTLILGMIIFASLLPGIAELYKERRKARPFGSPKTT